MPAIEKDAQNLIDDAQAVATQTVDSKLQLPDSPNLKTVDLDEHIKRGNTLIASIDIRKPNAGELRGVSLMDVAQMDVSALRKVLPRITSPSLTDTEIGNLSLSDIMQCGVIVAGFLLTKQQKADSGYLDA